MSDIITAEDLVMQEDGIEIVKTDWSYEATFYFGSEWDWEEGADGSFKATYPSEPSDKFGDYIDE